VWSVTVREGNGLGVFEDRVLKEIQGADGDTGCLGRYRVLREIQGAEGNTGC